MNHNCSQGRPGLTPALARTQVVSRELLHRLSEDLEGSSVVRASEIRCISVAGSLGRLEYSSVSDFDGVITCEDPRADVGGAIRDAIADIKRIVRRHGLRLPKSEGIYLRPIRRRALLDGAARGSLDESPAVFGTRMHFLLDGRPLFGASTFEALRESILEWYCPGPCGGEDYAYLMRDVVRYLNTYAVWQQHKFDRSEEDGWYLRQAKFRSSRIVTFAGLLFLLAESATKPNGIRNWLSERLDCSPIERIATVFRTYNDDRLPTILADYESVQTLMADVQVRDKLIRSSPNSRAEIPSTWPQPYADIDRYTVRLMDELTDFVLRRRDDWPRVIFRHWLL